MARRTIDEASAPSGPMSEGKRAYEARRAQAAGMSLDAWLARKAREAAAAAAPRPPAPPPRKKGLIGRLLDRAHKPL